MRAVEDRVNELVLANQPVRALTTTLDEARDLGAMALFGEKYGDVVRMVEIGDGGWSRELCGGTHVRSTAEIGAFKITTETSSAANVRRIEAITGPVAVATLRATTALLHDAAVALRTAPENVAEIAAEREAKRRELEKGGARRPSRSTPSSRRAVELDGVQAVVRAERRRRPEVAARTSRTGSRASWATPPSSCSARPARARSTSSSPPRPARSSAASRPATIVKAAAQVVGGGGGGRDNMAQAGGRDPEKLPEALAAARAEIERALAGDAGARRRARLRQRALRRRGLRSDAHARHAARAGPAPRHPQGLRPPDRPD